MYLQAIQLFNLGDLLEKVFLFPISLHNFVWRLSQTKCAYTWTAHLLSVMINYCQFAGCEQTLHSSQGIFQEDGNERSHLQDVFIISFNPVYCWEHSFHKNVQGEASWLKLWIITYYKDIFRKDNPRVKPGSQGKTEEILWQKKSGIYYRTWQCFWVSLLNVFLW